MKERLTFVVAADAENSAESIKISGDSVVVANCGPNCYGTASDFQYRITADLNELSQQVQKDLKGSDELHIRWISRKYVYNRAPFSSRLPPGLHVFQRERESDPGLSNGGHYNICESLSTAFAADSGCNNVSTSFSVLAQDSDGAKEFQWFKGLESLSGFQEYLKQHACGRGDLCSAKVAELESASYLDIDFDTATETITLTAVWRGLPGLAKTPIQRPADGNRLEIGVFKHHDSDSDSESELKFGGYLIDVGVDKKPSGTLFDFPSRHHTASPAVSIKFETPTGLHPRLLLQFKPSTPRPESCTLHAYFTLPSAIFIDRYQFSDPLVLASQNLIGLRSLTGEDDLEAPDWVVSRWGSAALFDLAVPKDSERGWNTTIPMHLRYMVQGAGSNDPQFAVLQVPHPTIFWACEETDPEISLSNNPFDRTRLGYDRLFSANTRFQYVQEIVSDVAYETIHVPALDKGAERWVPMGTFGVVVLGFGWICWQLLGARSRGGDRKEAVNARKKKQ